MKVEQAEIAKLIPDQANARKHDEKNIKAIAASLQRFGQQKPIVVDPAGVVRAGNGTLYAAQSLGWKKISVVRSDLENAEAAAYAIADNRTAELAEWDNEVLAQTLDQLDAEAIAATGFDEAEIAALLKDLSADFGPGTAEDQGKLDQLEPKLVTCPKCETTFDTRENG
jgi:ParB family transcriptional regulator, chromosome partitioning protein